MVIENGPNGGVSDRKLQVGVHSCVCVCMVTIKNISTLLLLI